MGDQPRAIEELTAGVTRGDPTQVLLGITGSGKTFTVAQVVERIQRPTLVIAHNKTLAHQLYDGVQDALPRQRHPLLRQLLRLLPARGVRPLDRHVHREGLAHQRRDRPHAPRGDVRAAHPARRADRRLGLLHLRHRRRRGLPGDEAGSRRAAWRSAATRSCAGWSRSSTSATTSTFHARHVPRARRHRRDLPRLRARKGDPRRVVRRRDRRDLRGRPAARQGPAQARRGVDLPRLALRDARRPAHQGDDRHQG